MTSNPHETVHDLIIDKQNNLENKIDDLAENVTKIRIAVSRYCPEDISKIKTDMAEYRGGLRAVRIVVTFILSPAIIVAVLKSFGWLKHIF